MSDARITLYHFGGTAGLPDISPFCVKLGAWMRLAGVAHEVKLGNPLKAPYGKLPYAKIDGQIVADSTVIIQRVQARDAVSLDQGLSPAQRAQARAWQSLLEEHLYFFIIRERWQHDAGWAVYRRHLKDVLVKSGAPGALAGVLLPSLRRKAVKIAHQQGVGRLDSTEAAALTRQLMQALATTLDDHAFMMGDEPTSVDASAYGMLAGVAPLQIPGAIKDAWDELPSLGRYCQAMRARLEG